MEGEGTFLIEPEVEPPGSMLHPLLMEEILDIVFRHLFGSPKHALRDEATHGATHSRKDIRSCRLVCKMWQNCATSIYRDVAPHLEFTLFGGMEHLIGMQKFLETMKDSSMIPRANYKIWVRDQMSGQRLLNEFLQVCGMEVVKLDLDITVDSSLESFRRITHWNMPALQHLKITFEERSCHIIPNHLHWIKQLLVSAEKLHHFDFYLDVWVAECVSEDLDEELYESELMLETLQVLPGTVNSLVLDFGTLRDSHLQQLNERNLHLHELTLFPRSFTECSHETIYNFFSGQSDTLTTLKLRGDGPCLISEDFPTLKELHHLDIQGDYACEPISFRDTFPKISILGFDFVYESDPYQPQKSRILCLNEAPWVRSLRFVFPASEYSSHDKLARNVAGCFTNLRVLNLDMSRVEETTHVLRQVFVLFREVEEFGVRLPGINEHRRSVSADSLFSGIPDADCKQLLESKNYDNLSLETVRQNPSVQNMPKLKKLAVVYTGRLEFTFSNVAVHFAFLQMNALEELRISKLKVCGSSLALLKNKLKVLKAEVMYVDSDAPISDSTAVSRIFL